jgi:sulfur carrier protein
MIRLTVNGEARQVAAGQTLADLVRAAGRDPRTVAVEHNGEIIKRERYGEVVLADGDRIEIVHFVQGG